MLTLRLEGRSYQYIANEAGVSRQRVQQVLSPPTEVRDFVVLKYDGYCSRCGLYVGQNGHIHHNHSNSENYNSVGTLELLCIACHRHRHNIPTQLRCLCCGKPNERKRGLFCSRDCHKKYHSITLICSRCGNGFALEIYVAKSRKKRSKNGLMFCSRKCWDEYRKGKLWGRQLSKRRVV